MNKITSTIKAIKPLDKAAMAKAQERQGTLTKPPGSLGRLEELSIRLAGVQRKPLPVIKNKVIITMAGDHGVVAEKVGNWPQEVTAQMVGNFLHGGAGINVLARQVNARIIVADMGVARDLAAHPSLLIRKCGYGTQNMCICPAMTAEQAVQAIETGIDIVSAEIAKGLDIVGTGDMGIGNTTPSAAICAVITGKPVATVTGRGTGLSDDQLKHKVNVIERAISCNHPDASQPLDVLAKVGGFEIGGLAGVMLGAAAHHVPVVIDGFISGAAALIATSLAPVVKEYLIAAHLSAEPGHQIMLDHMGLTPLLRLDMRLGEGTGAALGIFLAEAAARTLAEMATFTEAQVSEEEAKK
ncbi:MAG: nicotinate-nucleotide--dimethylbenzimidazole phosphoribosyltransferase [Dehalococcoidales bacterium]|nr:nicotinate-nucleotide--dimethylbenzimidazole phosphoribosyltransferase [Dehalococcoidales bacterium]